MHRPGRFELAAHEDPAISRSSEEAPGKLSIFSAQRVDPAIGRTELDPAAVDRRGRVDPPAGGVFPERFARLRIEAIDRVPIHRRYVDPAGGG